MLSHRTLALDLGTRCGVAVWTGEGAPVYDPAKPLRGSLDVMEWDLGLRPGEGGGVRPLRFRRALEKLFAEGPPIVELGYETVLFARAAAASHVYGELRGVLMMVCEAAGVPYRGIGISTAKAHATGVSGASKDHVAQMVVRRFRPVSPALQARGGVPLSDNMTDALAIMACVLDGVERAASPRRSRRARAPRAPLPGAGGA